VVTKVRVRSKNKGFGLCATKNILKNDIILFLEGIVTDLPSKYSIEIALGRHLHPFSTLPVDERCCWRFLNHSCEPNSRIDQENRSLIALTTIRKGEEIYFDYHSTEYDLAAPFACCCGSENCCKEIKGYKYLP